jgi:probable HAF family extracellular repeat protein
MTATVIGAEARCRRNMVPWLKGRAHLLAMAALLIGVVVGAPPAGAAPYAIVDLGWLGGPLADPWRSSVPHAINATGQVVGSGDLGNAFLNDFTGMHSLVSLDDPRSGGQAFGLNDAGQIVGTSPMDSGYDQAWLYSDGITRDLGTLGGRVSRAYDINSAGQVVGEAELPDGTLRAFLYDPQGGMRDLGTLSGSADDHSSAYAINNVGQVVGQSHTALETFHACLWENGAVRDLGSLPGYPYSAATDINDTGQVVGWSMSETLIFNTPTPMRAFLCEDGVMRDLGTLGGTCAQALEINNAGAVVGWSWTGDDPETSRAFLYTDGALLDLNSLLPPGSGWTLLEARAINDMGQIVGVGVLGGFERPFLMTPVMDPRANPPAGPTGLSARMVSPTAIDLAWTDNSSNETQFVLMRKTGAGLYARLVMLGPNQTRYTDTSAIPNTTYSYILKAANAIGASPWSNETVVTTTTLPPATPTPLRAMVASPTQVSLAWTDRSSNETQFVLLRKTGSGVYARVAVLEPNTTQYTDTSARPNTSYSYILRAYNNGGGSPWTNEVAVTTPDPRPARPTNLRAVAVSATQVNVTWEDRSSNETQFVLLRKIGSGLYQRIAVLSANTTSYVDATVSPGVTYTYITRAVNEAGVSAWSNEPSVTTPQ